MANYFRVSIKGLLPGGEVWSVNPVYQPLMGSVATDPAKMLAAATAVAGVVPGSELNLGISNNGSTTGARVEARDSSFNLLEVGEYSLPSPRVGNTPANKPNQTAVVLGLRTPYPGASNRGRLYWPALAIAMGSGTGKIASASVTALSTQAAAYLAAIGDALTGVFPDGDTEMLSVYSRTKGSARHVTQIWVGDVFDTQRRRRDAIVESYVPTNYVP